MLYYLNLLDLFYLPLLYVFLLVSLQDVVDSVWIIGIISALWFVLVTLFVLCRLWATLRSYRKAMAYYVKEVIEASES